MYARTANALSLWALCTLAAGVLMSALQHSANVTLLAVLGPLVLIAGRGLRPRRAFLAAGAVVLFVAAHRSGAGWVASTTASAVFLLCAEALAVALRRLDDIETLVGSLATSSVQREGRESFERALARELSRARRHQRPFAVLSIAPPAETIEAGGRAATLSEGTLRAISEQRALIEIARAVQGQLHGYADVAVAGGRVLALVPELAQEHTGPLEARVRQALVQALGVEVALGWSTFPATAVTANALIEQADAARLAAPGRGHDLTVVDGARGAPSTDAEHP